MHLFSCIVVAFTAFSFVAAVSPELLNAITAASNASLLWGPYRSNLYFGVKPRLPNSLVTGLLWLNADDYMSFSGTPQVLGFLAVECADWEDFDIRVKLGMIWRRMGGRSMMVG
jgi:Glycosyl hydrolase family 63 N-terminal domain